MTFRMTTSGEGGGDYRTSGRSPNSAHAVGQCARTSGGLTGGDGARWFLRARRETQARAWPLQQVLV